MQSTLSDKTLTVVVDAEISFSIKTGRSAGKGKSSPLEVESH